MLEGEIIVNSMTLKVEKVNAKAMIEGFWKGSQQFYVTIFTAHENAWSIKNSFRYLPKVLTPIQRINPRYRLSQIGASLRADYYDFAFKYVAALEKIYHIRNDENLWKILCSNGIFDIWDWTAPFNSLKDDRGPNKDVNDPRILLLRIYEVNYDFTNEVTIGVRADTIPQRRVQIVKPIIPQQQFDEIVRLLESVVRDYLQPIETFL